MDLRIHKTRRAIKNTFLRLLSEKNMDQLTVKELCYEAEISKGTFYLHYRDLPDLCDQLQREAIRRILSALNDPMEILTDPAGSLETLQRAVDAESTEVTPLFSGTQHLTFSVLLEQELKARIYEIHPEYRENVPFNVSLSYHIFGGYYAYMENRKQFGHEQVLNTIRQTHQAASYNFD